MFEHHPLTAALARELAVGRSSEREETTVCMLAAASLRHTYPGATVAVTPAPDRPRGELGLGVLDVRIAWPFGVERAVIERVVVHDELQRGLWRDASVAICDAVRAALAKSANSSPQPRKNEP